MTTLQFWGTRTTTTVQQEKQQQPKQQSTLLQKQMFVKNGGAFDIAFLLTMSKTN